MLARLNFCVQGSILDARLGPVSPLTVPSRTWGTSAMFSTAQRTLDANGFRGTTLGVLLVVGLLVAWGAWFLGAQVALYAVSDTARLEMGQAAHPVEAPVGGRVVATYLVLGQEVQGGDVLVELDA